MVSAMNYSLSPQPVCVDVQYGRNHSRNKADYFVYLFELLLNVPVNNILSWRNQQHKKMHLTDRTLQRSTTGGRSKWLTGHCKWLADDKYPYLGGQLIYVFMTILNQWSKKEQSFLQNIRGKKR